LQGGARGDRIEVAIDVEDLPVARRYMVTGIGRVRRGGCRRKTVRVMPSLLRRRARAVGLTVVVVALVTGCGRHPGPDVIVVAPDDVSLETDELVAQDSVDSLEWPQTIGLLCNRVDALRSVPDCLVSFGPQIEALMRSDVALALDVDDAVTTFCAADPEATRQDLDIFVGFSAQRLVLETPDATAADVKMAQTIGMAGYLGVIESQCPDRFPDVAIVAREVIIIYEL
jgi:hypothetical protein